MINLIIGLIFLILSIIMFVFNGMNDIGSVVSPYASLIIANIWFATIGTKRR